MLYNPDNGVTRNFMPHLWMFLLQSLTPPGHKVFLIDGNAQPMNEDELGQYVRANDIQLVGIGAMTRMAARAYRMADAIRAAGAKSKNFLAQICAIDLFEKLVHWDPSGLVVIADAIRLKGTDKERLITVIYRYKIHVGLSRLRNVMSPCD